jgi:hypothetical protein
MSFIRAKTQKSDYGESTYYYLVESYRDNGKVRHRTLAYLGKYPSVEAALEGLPQDIEKGKKWLTRLQGWLDKDKADYEKEAARFNATSKEETAEERISRGFPKPVYLYCLSRRDRRLYSANREYRRCEHSVNSQQNYVATLEAKLAKLQKIGRAECSA